MTIREVLINIRERLQNAGIEDFEYESWAFLDWKLHIDRAEFYMNPNGEVKEELLAELESVLKQREQRVPLQYLMGECEFMGYDFYVDERVLIPRQDTEILVEEVLKELHDGMRVLDMCTGSGCILLSLLHYSNACEGLGVDLSADALEVAEQNAETLLDAVNADRVHFLQSDLFDKVEGKFEIIVSNPPYIASAEVEKLMPEVRDHEPRMALDGTEDGLHFYRRIIEEAGKHLVSSGMLFFEIGYDQGQAVSELMRTEGYREVQVVQDYAGLDRVVFGTYVTVQPAPFAKSR